MGLMWVDLGPKIFILWTRVVAKTTWHSFETCSKGQKNH